MTKHVNKIVARESKTFEGQRVEQITVFKYLETIEAWISK